MATKLDGIGDKVVESKAGQFIGHLLKEAYHQAGVKWEQGMIELGNAMYQGTPVPLPQALTINQIDAPDLKTQYETNLSRASEKAHQQQPEQEMER